jgi:hypothetical protein
MVAKKDEKTSEKTSLIEYVRLRPTTWIAAIALGVTLFSISINAAHRINNSPTRAEVDRIIGTTCKAYVSRIEISQENLKQRIDRIETKIDKISEFLMRRYSKVE